MTYSFQYQNDTDKQNIVNENSNKFLIEVKNLFTGNFLIFSDVQPQVQTQIITEPLDLTRITNLENENAQMLLALVTGGLI